MKQLLILSGKGGTGKTTIAAAFIKLSAAKAYADCDVDAPNLHLIMGQNSEPQKRGFYGLPKAEINRELCIKCDRCRQNCRFEAILMNEEYIIDAFACEGCGVCEALCHVGAVALKPAAAGELMLYSDEGGIFSTARLKMGSGASGMLVTEVKKQMRLAAENEELAIIDGSPGIGCPVIASLSGVDMVLIVAEPSVSGISDMKRIIKTAETFQTKAAVCVNKYDTNIANTERIKEYCRTNNLPFAGRIPFDPEAVKAINNGLTVVDINCPSGIAVREVFNKTIKLLFDTLTIYYLHEGDKKMSEQCNQNCSSCSESCTERKEEFDFSEKPHVLSSIKKVIGVVSGKGGVGKSLVTSMLAVTMNRMGYHSAVLDADITGPSIPKAFGIREKARGSETGLYPIKSHTGIDIMSINLLLDNDKDPVVWRGPILANTVKQFWSEVIWSDVDFMFIDMPPGTGDVPLTVFQSIAMDGIIIVTSPQELVSMIVSKAVRMAEIMNIPIIGLVENMSYFKCPDNDKEYKIFGDSHIDEIAEEHNLKVLAKLPIDPRLSAACDKGMIELFEGDWMEPVGKILENMEDKK